MKNLKLGNTPALVQHRGSVHSRRNFFAALIAAGLTAAGCSDQEPTPERRTQHRYEPDYTPRPSVEIQPSFDIEKISQEVSQVLGRTVRLIQQKWEGQPEGDYLQGTYISLVHDDPEEFVFKLIFDKKGEKCISMIREIPPDSVLAQVPGNFKGTNISIPQRKGRKLVEKVLIEQSIHGDGLIEKIRESMSGGSKSYHTTTAQSQYVANEGGTMVVRGSPGLAEALLYIESHPESIEIRYGTHRVTETHTYATLARQGFSRHDELLPDDLRMEFKMSPQRTFRIDSQSFERDKGGKWKIMHKNFDGSIQLVREDGIDGQLVISSVYRGG